MNPLAVIQTISENIKLVERLKTKTTIVLEKIKYNVNANPEDQYDFEEIRRCINNIADLFDHELQLTQNTVKTDIPDHHNLFIELLYDFVDDTVNNLDMEIIDDAYEQLDSTVRMIINNRKNILDNMITKYIDAVEPYMHLINKN
jgi:hypothetical protein